jgi:hypothetical protein
MSHYIFKDNNKTSITNETRNTSMYFQVQFFRKLIFLLGQLIVLNSYLNASHITLWPDLTDFVQQIIEHFLLLVK